MNAKYPIVNQLIQYVWQIHIIKHNLFILRVKKDKKEISYRSKIEVVKHFDTIFPWIRITIFSYTLFVKPIYLCDLSIFMIVRIEH